MKLNISVMSIDNYDDVRALWEITAGIGLSSADSRSAIGLYLARNPNLSFVAYDGSLLVGVVLCGHDGRRGISII